MTGCSVSSTGRSRNLGKRVAHVTSGGPGLTGTEGDECGTRPGRDRASFGASLASEGRPGACPSAIGRSDWFRGRRGRWGLGVAHASAVGTGLSGESGSATQVPGRPYIANDAARLAARDTCPLGRDRQRYRRRGGRYRGPGRRRPGRRLPFREPRSFVLPRSAAQVFLEK